MTDEKSSERAPVAIRIAEWKAWIPSAMVDLGVRHEAQSGVLRNQKMPLHNGFTFVDARPTERLINLEIEPTGHTRVVELEENNEDGSPKQVMYGLYVFQAVFATNVVRSDMDEVLMQQNAALEMGERRAEEKGHHKDIIIAGRDGKAEHIVEDEAGAKRAVSRGAKRPSAKSGKTDRKRKR